MRSFLPRLLPVLALILPAVSVSAADVPSAPPQAAEARRASEPINEKNLIANEESWPFHVSLRKDLSREGQEALKPGKHGVLVRVEELGRVRIDFGRDGRLDVPIASTDVVERANEVRLGQLHKTTPNFVLSVGPRLLLMSGRGMRTYGLLEANRHAGFLAVFADPSSQDLPALARALEPLEDRHGVLTIFFPAGELQADRVSEYLAQAEWEVPFMPYPLSPGYIRAFVGDEAELPVISLQTPEGRLLYEGRADPSSLPSLTKALDDAFQGSPNAGRTARRQSLDTPG